MRAVVRPATVTAVAALAVAAAVVPAAADDRHRPAPASRHVLLLSVDGLHQSDLTWWVTHHPDSALTALVARGRSYTHALTTFPSDSFPGMVAQLTGAQPATSGVYYDDTYNRQLLAPGTVDCRAAQPGTEVSLTEAADRSQDPITLDAGQGLTDPHLKALTTNSRQQTLADQDALTHAILAMTPTPQALLNPGALPVDPATCLPVQPSQYLQVNTVFEVAHQHGLRTAWSDKHPAYAILDGPSGAGLDDLFTPEINSVSDATGDDWTTDNALTREYDAFKAAAVRNEIAGKDHSGSRTVGEPAIFGMNFQAVSTAQKLPASDGLAGGYAADGTPGPLLQAALASVDTQVGTFEQAIAHSPDAARTTIVLSAKHGQSPEDLASLRRVDDGAIVAAIDAAWAAQHPNQPKLVTFSVDDDAMLLWLADRSPAATSFVRSYLLSHAAPANRAGDAKGSDPTTVSSSGLTTVYAGDAATRFLGARPGDARTPDVVGLVQHGVVYTGGVKKIAEHGGDDPQDRNVPLVVAGAGVGHATSDRTVSTAQIAPTILALLGLDPRALQGVRQDGTATLGR